MHDTQNTNIPTAEELLSSAFYTYDASKQIALAKEAIEKGADLGAYIENNYSFSNMSNEFRIFIVNELPAETAIKFIFKQYILSYDHEKGKNIVTEDSIETTLNIIKKFNIADIEKFLIENVSEYIVN